MKNGRIKNSIIFHLDFTTTKMAGLHVSSYTDEDKHGVECSICALVNTFNLTPAITPNSQKTTIENTVYLFQEAITESYSSVASRTIASDQLFSRTANCIISTLILFIVCDVQGA